MPHHFHDINGWLIFGIDQHDGVHWPTPIPVPMPFWELNVMHPFIMGGNQAAKTKFNGVNAVKDQHNPKLLWPHFPFSPDPLNILFPIDLLMGDHKTWLSRGSVLTEDSPTPCCAIYGPISINLECWSMGHLPTSLIIQAGTVETTPSLGDYAACIARAAIDFAVEYVLYRLTKGEESKAHTRQGYGKLKGNLEAIVSHDATGLAKKASIFVGSGRATVTNQIKKALMAKLNPLSFMKKNGSFVSAGEMLKGVPGLANFAGGAFSFDPGGVVRGDVVTSPTGPWDYAKGVFPPAGGVQGLIQGAG
jgi:hypothetical protein